MKIMTYNILEGGIDKNGSRIEHILDVIKGVDPDFIALQEANNFEKSDNELLKEFSSETDLPHYALSKGALYDNKTNHNVAVLSRYPLREKYTFPDLPFQSAALGVVIDSPVGDLSVCAVHLNAYSEDYRLEELAEITKYQSKYERGIILGDFNALSRTDEHGDLTAEEFTHYGLTRFDVIDTLSKGYVDVMAHLHVKDRKTHPTNGISHPISRTLIRIDYVFVTQSLSSSIKNGEVIKTETSEVASDHYSVAVTLI